MHNLSYEYISVLKSINKLVFLHKEYIDMFGNSKYIYMGALPVHMAFNMQYQASLYGDIIHLTLCTSEYMIASGYINVILN